METPIDSEPPRRRVTFANQPSGIETITVKPQMEAVGEFEPEFLTGRKVKFTRTQMSRIGSNSNGELTTNSMTSIRAHVSGPPDGLWEPTLDPYAPSLRSDNAIAREVDADSGVDTRENRFYSPRLQGNGYNYGHTTRKRLASVQEL